MTYLCKDCANSRVTGEGRIIDSYVCTVGERLEPVMGEFMIGATLCYIMRAHGEACGPDGMMWRQKSEDGV